jgi:hypothetical protein
MRSMKRIPRSLFAAGFALSCALGVARVLLAQPVPPPSLVTSTVDPITGSVELTGGSRAQFTYYFDHNALADAVLAGQHLLAITNSGNLLQFDLASLEISAQAIVPKKATYIASEGDDRALIGTASGHIYRVRSGTVQLEPVVSANGSVVWMSSRSGASGQDNEIVFVVDRSPDIYPWPGENDKAYQRRERAAAIKAGPTYAVEVYERGKLRELPFPDLRLFTIPGHYLLGPDGRLWMGADNGEWGGKCYYMDLRTGAVRTLKDGINGVLGFLLAPQGRVIIYGGMAHMGSYEGYVAEVNPNGITKLADFDFDSWGEIPPNTPVTGEVQRRAREAAERKAQEDKDHPKGPIDLIEIDSAEGGFWVVSQQILFHASEDFHEWKRMAELGGRWIAGRRFSVGGTPTINELFALPNDKHTLVAVMGRDGLERISGGHIEKHQASGQLEGTLTDLWQTANGPLFVDEGPEDHGLWMLQRNFWRRLSLFPDKPPADDGTDWYFAEPFGNEGSPILAFAHDNLGPGIAFLIKLNDRGEPSIVNSWPGDSSEFETAFVRTSDDVILKTAEKKLLVWRGKEWEDVGVSEYSSDLDRRMTMNGRKFEILGSVGESDYFRETEYGDLYRLYKPSGVNKSYNLVRLKFSDEPDLRGIFDAVRDGKNSVLVTTATGILELDLGTGRRVPIPSPNREDEITSACRDTRGWLWAVGDFLYVSHDDGKNWAKVELPMMTRTALKRVRPNPTQTSEMFVTLGEIGAATIDLQ